MTRITIFFLLLLPGLSGAQMLKISTDTLWLHHAISEEEDLDSYFPIINRENNPGVSDIINTALQMQELGFTLTEKNKVSFTHPDPGPLGRTNYSYGFKRLNDRLFYVDIYIFHTNNAMSLNGWDEIHRYYFDANSGQPVVLRDIFSQPTLHKQNEALTEGFTTSLVETMSHYREGFTKDSIATMDRECECGCGESVKTAWCQDWVRLDYNDKSHQLIFQMDACMWSNPGPHDIYSISIDVNTAAPWLTPYGKFLFLGGTPVQNDTPYKLWKGTIGQNIPVTFMIKIKGCDVVQGVGREVYDKFGTVIPLSFTTAYLPTITLSELDPNGKPVATIDAQLQQNGQLVGHWTKADKSKTLPFVASPAK